MEIRKDGGMMDKRKTRTKTYMAYGSNMNIAQMKKRCPGAAVLGTAVLKGWTLKFNSVATIVRKDGAEVPVVLWRITEACERALDVYEGYPRLYRKEAAVCEFEGKEVECMVYVMNESARERAMPYESYYDTIRQGYMDNDLDVRVLDRFVEENGGD